MSFDPSRTLVVDVETGGFAGTPVFLLGVVCPDQRPLCVEQYLVRDYPEEAALLVALADLSDTRDTWVTFNGRSFDVPVLLERAALHRVRVRPPARHIDLLHLARRRWKGQVTNCRLTTLEREVLGYHRVGDVPSRDVPDLLHHFVATGNARPLQPVLAHNVRDLVTAYELLLRLAERPTDSAVPGPDAA
ncbi:MAG: ribonuclease H-like domain-containing protein [Hydrogenophilaceae bacterium]|nr:ribonuclease H-like domain-containing protein [Hydrogenophilaceae bacterium]